MNDHENPKVTDHLSQSEPSQEPGGLSRRAMLKSVGGVFGAGALGLSAPSILSARPALAQDMGASLPEKGEFLIKGGSIVSVDSEIGNVVGSDIHVKDGVIAAIGPGLSSETAEVIDASEMIVMPGMVDTHYHIWTSIMRNMLDRDFEYFGVKRAFVPHMTPEAFYASDMLAMAECLNAGITTVHNFCHHVVSAETVEAEMQAHWDSGMRVLYTFGHPDGLDGSQTIDLPLAESIYSNWFTGSGALVDRGAFGINSRGPHRVDEAVFKQEIDWAFDRDLTFAMHLGQGGYNFSVVPLMEQGYLGPKTLCVHFVHATPEDRAAMVETGAPLSYSIHSELRLGNSGYQAQQIVQMFNDGVLISLSADGNSLAPIDIFEAMSTIWYLGIPYEGDDSEGLERINFPDVIKMGTINGAKALGMGDVTGSLTVGKKADIVLVRATDLNMVPYGNVEAMVGRAARAANVDTVIADGRLMKKGGQMVGLDVEAIKEAAVKAAYDVRSAAGGQVAPKGDMDLIS